MASRRGALKGWKKQLGRTSREHGGSVTRDVTHHGGTGRRHSLQGVPQRRCAEERQVRHHSRYRCPGGGRRVATGDYGGIDTASGVPHSLHRRQVQPRVHVIGGYHNTARWAHGSTDLVDGVQGERQRQRGSRLWGQLGQACLGSP
jgi:hypothetical protein